MKQIITALILLGLLSSCANKKPVTQQRIPRMMDDFPRNPKQHEKIYPQQAILNDDLVIFANEFNKIDINKEDKVEALKASGGVYLYDKKTKVFDALADQAIFKNNELTLYGYPSVRLSNRLYYADSTATTFSLIGTEFKPNGSVKEKRSIRTFAADYESKVIPPAPVPVVSKPIKAEPSALIKVEKKSTSPTQPTIEKKDPVVLASSPKVQSPPVTIPKSEPTKPDAKPFANLPTTKTPTKKSGSTKFQLIEPKD
jgi:hypothetical protein